MAGTIKGITVEFRGDTTKLDKALSDVNKKTKDIDRELNQVKQDLKFNPTSVELWKQKQTLLTAKVQETTEKLDLLKQAQKQMDTDKVDQNSAEYRELRREIIETESKLKTFKGQLKEIGDVKLTALQKQFEGISKATRGLSMAGGAVAGGLLANTFNAAKQADDIATLAQRYNVTTDEVQKFQYAQELVDVSTESMLGSMQKMEKQMGANNSAFQELGVSITDANGNYRDSAEVWYDVLQALGNVENGTQRDILAQELFGRSAAELAGIIDDGGAALRAYGDEAEEAGLIMAGDDVDAAHEFNDALDKLKNVLTGNLLKAGASLAESLLPVFEKISAAVGTVLTWFGNLDGRTQKLILTVAGVVAAISPVAGIIGKIMMAINTVKTAMMAIMPVLTGVLSPVVLIIGAIAALAAGLIYAYNHSEKFRAIVDAAFNKIKEVIATVISFIQEKLAQWRAEIGLVIQAIQGFIERAKERFESFKQKVAEVIDSIKEKWESLKEKVQSVVDWIGDIPEKVRGIIQRVKDAIKLPHFSLNGDFSLVPPRVPKLSVDWYANGGIFNSPTIAGIGEAGSEAVVPLDKFWRKLETMGGNEIVINVYGSEGQSAREIASEVKRMLVAEAKRGQMVWA